MLNKEMYINHKNIMVCTEKNEFEMRMICLNVIEVQDVIIIRDVVMNLQRLVEKLVGVGCIYQL